MSKHKQMSGKNMYRAQRNKKCLQNFNWNIWEDHFGYLCLDENILYKVCMVVAWLHMLHGHVQVSSFFLNTVMNILLSYKQLISDEQSTPFF